MFCCDRKPSFVTSFLFFFFVPESAVKSWPTLSSSAPWICQERLIHRHQLLKPGVILEISFTGTWRKEMKWYQKNSNTGSSVMLQDESTATCERCKFPDTISYDCVSSGSVCIRNSPMHKCLCAHVHAAVTHRAGWHCCVTLSPTSQTIDRQPPR